MSDFLYGVILGLPIGIAAMGLFALLMQMGMDARRKPRTYQACVDGED